MLQGLSVVVSDGLTAHAIFLPQETRRTSWRPSPGWGKVGHSACLRKKILSVMGIFLPLRKRPAGPCLDIPARRTWFGPEGQPSPRPCVSVLETSGPFAIFFLFGPCQL